MHARRVCARTPPLELDGHLIPASRDWHQRRHGFARVRWQRPLPDSLGELGAHADASQGDVTSPSGCLSGCIPTACVAAVGTITASPKRRAPAPTNGQSDRQRGLPFRALITSRVGVAAYALQGARPLRTFAAKHDVESGNGPVKSRGRGRRERLRNAFTASAPVGGDGGGAASQAASLMRLKAPSAAISPRRRSERPSASR